MGLWFLIFFLQIVPLSSKHCYFCKNNILGGYTLWGIKNTPKLIDHNLKADYRIVIIFGNNYSWHNLPSSSFHLTQHMLFALPGEIKTHEIGVKINKKTIYDIRPTDSNLGKNNEILIVFDRNISDITGHQMAVQIPNSSNACCCITRGNRTSATWNEEERKTSVNLVITDT